MDINKKNRSQLKSYFVKNSIPTQSNFEELIDGMLNQKDDGIVKSPDALCIEATGDLAGLQRVINFYAKFQDANPAWSLQLNPRADANDPTTAKQGFCVVDGTGWARLFIDQKTGNVGIGTTAPIAKLDIHQSALARVDTHPTAIKGLYITADFGEDKDGIEFRHRNGSQGIGFGYNTIYAAGSNLNQDLQLKPKGTGVVRVLGNVDIKASQIKFDLIANGGGQLIVTNTMGGDKVSLEGRNKDATRSADELFLTGKDGGNVPKLSLMADMTLIKGSVDIKGSVELTGTLKMGMGSNSAGLEFRNRSGIMFLESFSLDARGVPLASPDLTLSGRNITNVPALTLMADMTLIKGDLTINGSIISEKWIDAKLENSWVRYTNDYNPPQFFKDNAGIVWLRGLVKGGSSTIFTLPEGYRPSNRQLHVVSISSNDWTTSVFGRVDVTKDGKIVPVVGSTIWTSLDGISFRAAQ